MASLRQYQLGKKHGLAGIRHMAHRAGRPYDGRGAQESYNHGYKEGFAERMKTGKTLDYKQPLNNRLFE